jgi:hypothetical protein
MNENIFTTALYLFSSLLQADAAILGIGVVFIIYKLQDLNNRIQFATEVCRINEFNLGQDAAYLMMKEKTDEEKGHILTKRKTSSIYPYLESLITIQGRIEEIKRKIKLPLLWIGIHCFLSSIFLWGLQNTYFYSSYFFWIIYFVILTFGVGIGLTVWIAWEIITRKDELNLERTNKNIYSIVYSSK